MSLEAAADHLRETVRLLEEVASPKDLLLRHLKQGLADLEGRIEWRVALDQGDPWKRLERLLSELADEIP